MAGLIIADLLIDGEHLRSLTKDEEKNTIGGATGAGSISAARYSQRGDIVEEEAVTASVATSDRRPFDIDLVYSYEPLFVSAGVSFR